MHETMKGKLVNTLDTERWTQCDVSAQRQTDVDRLAWGNAFVSATNNNNNNNNTTAATSSTAAEVMTTDANADTAASSSSAATGSAGESLAVNSDCSPSLPTPAPSSSSSSTKNKKELKAVLVDGASFKVAQRPFPSFFPLFYVISFSLSYGSFFCVINHPASFTTLCPVSCVYVCVGGMECIATDRGGVGVSGDLLQLRPSDH